MQTHAHSVINYSNMLFFCFIHTHLLVYSKRTHMYNQINVFYIFFLISKYKPHTLTHTQTHAHSVIIYI